MGFTVSPDERAQIAEAARIKRLKPSTYMKRLVMAQAERDIADDHTERAAQAEAQVVEMVRETPEREMLVVLADQVSMMAETLRSYLEKEPRVQKS